MSHDRIGYRNLETAPAPGWRSVSAICRWNLQMVIRQKMFWFLVSLGLLSFLYHYAIIYIKAQITVESPQFAQFLDRFMVTGDGRGYREFLAMQARAVVLIMAYAGAVLVANDFRAGGIAFYLSRPINKYHYVFGKAFSLWMIIGLLTLAPGLFLFAAYGFLSNSMQYFWDNPRIAMGIAAYSLIIMTVPSLLVLAVGAVCRGAAPLLMVWCGIFLLLPAFSELLKLVFDSNDWLFMNLWRNMHVLGRYFFGAKENAHDILWSTIIIGWVCVGSIAVLRWRLRAVEVVE